MTDEFRRQDDDRRLTRLEEKVEQLPAISERFNSLTTQIELLAKTVETNHKETQADMKELKTDLHTELHEFRSNVTRWVMLGITVMVPLATWIATLITQGGN
jgi:hypothetical protein